MPDSERKVRAAYEAIRAGKVQIPLRCGYCRGSSLYADVDDLEAFDVMVKFKNDPDKIKRLGMADQGYFTCTSCGHRTLASEAKAKRQKEIREYLIEQGGRLVDHSKPTTTRRRKRS